MSEVESTSDQTESNDPLWQVQLASGQVCRMTLELLDDAFQDGLITEDTLIMQDGTTEWVTLRQVAGLDSDAESELPGQGASAATVATSAPVASVENPPLAASPVAPVAAVVAAPVQRAPQAYMDPFAPPIQAAQMVPPAAAQTAPFVFQGAAPNPSFAPQFASAPPDPLTRSTAPVAADIDFDLDTVARQSFSLHCSLTYVTAAPDTFDFCQGSNVESLRESRLSLTIFHGLIAQTA